MKTNTISQALTLLRSPHCLVVLVLGFSAGVPSLLISSTLGIWLRGAGASYETIGYAVWIGLIYALKWVWAPMLDLWRLPWLSKLGRRRSWLVFSQACIFIGLVCIACTDPQQHLTIFIMFACLVAFFSATQDIAVDAYRLEIVGHDQQAAVAASYITGFRLALLAAGSGALLMTTYLGSSDYRYYYRAWQITYLTFALLMIPAIIISLTISEPEIKLQQSALAESEFSFSKQLVSVILVLFLVVSLPIMVTAIMDQAWPRALFYALILATCLSPWGKSQILPVRVLLRRMRHHLKIAARSKEIPNFDFVHQSVSIIIMLIILVTLYAMSKAYWYGAWPRGTLYLLVFVGCVLAPGRFLMAPILTPMVEFIQRYRWQALLIIGIVSTYKLADTMAGGMVEIFLLDNGFTANIVAVIPRGIGMIFTIIGATASIFLIARFKVLPVLFFGGVICAVTNVLYILLIQYQGITPPSESIWEQLTALNPHLWTLVWIVIVDNLSAGMATSALLAYLSGLTNLKFSASQYAMLSSMMLLFPKFFGGYSGQIVKTYGYEHFFTVCVLLGIPSSLLIIWAWVKQRTLKV